MRAHPDFAGREVSSVEWGGDPPDILCVDTDAKRIGIELVQWINQTQVAASKALFKLENTYNRIIQSQNEQPPANIGLIFIYTKSGVLLAAQNAAAFRQQIFAFVRRIDADWAKNPAWDDPQGYPFTDFTGYPLLTQHLEGLDFYSRGSRFSPMLGQEWIMFRSHGGAFTHDWMLTALLDNINRKIAKYAKPQNQLKLQQQQLDDFYLLAYYDEAVLHNTSYHGPNFGFQDIGAILTRNLSANPHPFDKVFLYSPIEKVPVLRVWP